MGIKWVGIGIGEKGWKEPQVQSYAGRTDQQPLGYVNRHLGHCPRLRTNTDNYQIQKLHILKGSYLKKMGVVAHAFKTASEKQKEVVLCEFPASLSYIERGKKMHLSVCLCVCARECVRARVCASGGQKTIYGTILSLHPVGSGIQLVSSRLRSRRLYPASHPVGSVRTF